MVEVGKRKVRTYTDLPKHVLQALQEVAENPSTAVKYERLGIEGDCGSVYDFFGMALKVYKEDADMMGDAVPLYVLKGGPYFPRLIARCTGRFVLMERIEGISLTQYILQGNALSEGILEHLKKAIDYMMERSVILWDLHMDNIILRNEVPVIIDAGDYYSTSYSFYTKDMLFNLILIHYEEVVKNAKYYAEESANADGVLRFAHRKERKRNEPTSARSRIS